MNKERKEEFESGIGLFVRRNVTKYPLIVRKSRVLHNGVCIHAHKMHAIELKLRKYLFMCFVFQLFYCSVSSVLLPYFVTALRSCMSNKRRIIENWAKMKKNKNSKCVSISMSKSNSLVIRNCIKIFLFCVYTAYCIMCSHYAFFCSSNSILHHLLL